MTSGNWPYHMDPHGNAVKCASNPCRLHGLGEDVMASSPEEAYKKLMARSQNEPGMHSTKAGRKNSLGKPQGRIASVGYEQAASDVSPVDKFNVSSYLEENVDKSGMLPSSWSDHETFVKQMEARENLENKHLTDQDQEQMLSIAENPEFMNHALESDDGFPDQMYSKMPAATEMINTLSSNSTTSGKSLSRIVDIAVARRGNPNFRRQVYVTDIANHPNLSSKDAMRLYKAYPEDCVRAQRFNKDIINTVLKDPTSPERVRAIAITNPNASVDAMEKAIKDGGDTYRAQAMLNPNGKYLNVARRERKKRASMTENEMRTFNDDQQALERFRKRLKDRIGIA